MIEHVMLVTKLRLMAGNRDCPIDRIPQSECEHSTLRRVVYDSSTLPVFKNFVGEGPAWFDTETRHAEQ